MAATETIRALAERIRTLETSFRPCAPRAIPLGALGELFPDGLSAGSLVELLPRVPGAGAWTLALILARHACGERKTLLITDPERCFYPPAAQKFGMDVNRTIIIRSKKSSDALLALAQGLRCSAIGAAIGAFDKLADRDARRLQLAAEDGGTLGVLVRPASALGAPSFAAVRLLLEPLPSSCGRRRVQIEVVRFCGLALAENNQNEWRSSASAKRQAAHVEIDDATGHVRPLSVLELAADSPRTTRATG